jgi:hypothetical protein
MSEYGALVELYWQSGTEVLTVRNRSTGSKICLSAALSTTDFTWTDLGQNRGLSDDRPTTNRLSYPCQCHPTNAPYPHIIHLSPTATQPQTSTVTLRNRRSKQGDAVLQSIHFAGHLPWPATSGNTPNSRLQFCMCSHNDKCTLLNHEVPVSRTRALLVARAFTELMFI